MAVTHSLLVAVFWSSLVLPGFDFSLKGQPGSGSSKDLNANKTWSGSRLTFIAHFILFPQMTLDNSSPPPSRRSWFFHSCTYTSPSTILTYLFNLSCSGVVHGDGSPAISQNFYTSTQTHSTHIILLLVCQIIISDHVLSPAGGWMFFSSCYYSWESFYFSLYCT